MASLEDVPLDVLRSLGLDDLSLLSLALSSKSFFVLFPNNLKTNKEKFSILAAAGGRPEVLSWLFDYCSPSLSTSTFLTRSLEDSLFLDLVNRAAIKNKRKEFILWLRERMPREYKMEATRWSLPLGDLAFSRWAYDLDISDGIMEESLRYELLLRCIAAGFEEMFDFLIACPTFPIEPAWLAAWDEWAPWNCQPHVLAAKGGPCNRGKTLPMLLKVSQYIGQEGKWYDLYQAAIEGQSLETVKYVFSLPGAAVIDSAVGWAVSFGTPDILRFLLDRYIERNGNLPDLTNAIGDAKIECLRVLLSYPVAAFDSDHLMAIAIQNPDPEIWKLCVDAFGATPHDRDFAFACLNPNREAAWQFLLNALGRPLDPSQAVPDAMSRLVEFEALEFFVEKVGKSNIVISDMSFLELLVYPKVFRSVYRRLLFILEELLPNVVLTAREISCVAGSDVGGEILLIMFARGYKFTAENLLACFRGSYPQWENAQIILEAAPELGHDAYRFAVDAFDGPAILQWLASIGAQGKIAVDPLQKATPRARPLPLPPIWLLPMKPKRFVSARHDSIAIAWARRAY